MSNLLPGGTKLEAGVYKMTFATGTYFYAQDKKTFYPKVEVS